MQPGLIPTNRINKDLHKSINHQTKPLFFLQQQSLPCHQFSGLHRPRQFVKHRPFQVSKHFDRAQKLIEIIRQPRFRVSLLRVRKQIDLRFFTLRFGWETAVHVKVAVANEPYHGGHEGAENDQSVDVSSATYYFRRKGCVDVHGCKIHGERQTHRK